MSMKNLDGIREKLKEISQKMFAAHSAGDAETVQQCMEEYGKLYADMTTGGKFEEFMEQLDNNVITARGIRRLSVEERAYFDALKEANKSSNVKQALNDLPKAFPQTILNTILDDIRTEHELFNHIDLRVTELNVKEVYSEEGTNKATWGPITGKITTELSLTIKAIDGTQHKLTAFIPIPKGYIDFSTEWLATLVITFLTEALALGLEDGIINGTGKNMPIGMTMDLKGSVNDGVYTAKTLIKVTEFSRETYSPLVANIAKTESGKARTVTQVILIVNPVDYLSKICPATTVQRVDATYAHDVFPFPTKVIQSAAVAEGRAIMGLDRAYLQTVGAHKNGVIESDDSYQFLDDNRVYAAKLYGNGRPKDNTSFIVLDISKLKVTVPRVQIDGTVNTAASPAA